MGEIKDRRTQKICRHLDLWCATPEVSLSAVAYAITCGFGAAGVEWSVVPSTLKRVGMACYEPDL